MIRNVSKWLFNLTFEKSLFRQNPGLAVQGKLPDVGGNIDLGNVFPGLKQFHLPPIPRLAVVNVLRKE
jgi:hypothetical protein